MIIHTDEQIFAILKKIRHKQPIIAGNREHIERVVQSTLDRAAYAITENKINPDTPPWLDDYALIGAAPELLQDRPYHNESFAAMLLDKHQRYGDGPMTRWGHAGLIIRIDSKWERYKNLKAGGDTEDTLKDILGYCVLGFAYQEYLNAQS